jgi:hypothetical protein
MEITNVVAFDGEEDYQTFLLEAATAYEHCGGAGEMCFPYQNISVKTDMHSLNQISILKDNYS